MSNLDEERLGEIYHRYAKALMTIADSTPFVGVDAARLALGLALRDASNEAENHLELWRKAQMDIVELRADLIATQDKLDRAERERLALEAERNHADERCRELEDEIAGLRSQLAAMDADNARLTQEMQRLRSNALAVAAQNGKSAPGGFVLSEAAHDYLLGLEAGRWKWRQIPKSVQVELVRSIIATTEDRTQAQFDACKPAYMPTATAHVAAFATIWRELADLSREIEVVR